MNSSLKSGLFKVFLSFYVFIGSAPQEQIPFVLPYSRSIAQLLFYHKHNYAIKELNRLTCSLAEPCLWVNEYGISNNVMSSSYRLN